MSICHLAGALAAVALLVSTSQAGAQCTMDTECKADRICEDGKCVASPAATLPPSPAAPRTAAAPAAPPPAAAAPAPLPVAPPAPEKPKMRRNSTGMMVGGIVMVSLSPLALFLAGAYGLAGAVCSYDCEDYETTAKVSLVSALVLAGTGVPLIVVGAQKVPVDDTATATITPWAAPHAVGLGLRLEL